MNHPKQLKFKTKLSSTDVISSLCKRPSFKQQNLLHQKPKLNFFIVHKFLSRRIDRTPYPANETDN